MTEFLVRLFIKNPDDTNDVKVRGRYGLLCGLVGIACNVILCSLKIAVGIITSSISVIADGLNNLSDMGSSVITMIGFKLAGKPADSDHPFGHGRMEYMSAFVVSVIILIVGGELFISSVKDLLNGTAAPVYDKTAVIVLAVSILVKLWMFIFNRKLGKKINAEALMATAQDSINDCITTAVILASVIISMLFKPSFNLDAVMAAAVALFIIYSGLSAARDTLNQILGEPPSKELTEAIENTIMSFDGFIGIHDLIVHNYGPGRQFASVHVEVPQDIDIVKCHEQIDICEKLVNERLDVALVIHMDPIDTNDENVAAARSAMTDGLKKIDERLSLHDFRMTSVGENHTNLIFDVVVPSSVKISNAELDKRISETAKQINKSYICVITFDNDFTGK